MYYLLAMIGGAVSPFVLIRVIHALARKRRQEGTPDPTPSQIRTLARHALISEWLPWLTFPCWLLVGWVWRGLSTAGLLRPYPDPLAAWVIAGSLPLVDLTLGVSALLRLGLHTDAPRARIRARTGIVFSCWAFAIVLIMTPYVRPSRESNLSDICREHLKTLSASLELYARDHDGLYPSAETWADSAAPYVEEAPRHDAAAFAFFCPNGERRSSDYAFNAALGGVAREAVLEADKVIVLFKSDGGRNADGGPELLPDEPRHFGGDNYGFADGSTAWIPREGFPDGPYAKEPEAQVRWEVEGEFPGGE